MTRPTVDMMEALRLTRQGRLEEAMAVLRGAPPAAEAAPGRGDGTATVIDMVPPSDQSGSAWTAPPTARRRRRPQPRTARRGVRSQCRLRSLAPPDRAANARRGRSRNDTTGAARRGDVRKPRLRQRGRQPGLQALCSERLQRASRCRSS